MQWSVIGNAATLQWAAWHWSLDLAQPSAGIQLNQPTAAPTAWQLLQILPQPQHSCQIEDWFARGSDLMVRYGQSPDDRFAFQIDYRAVDVLELGTFICGWDLWLSVQTQLLDSHPVLEVISRVPGGRWRAVDSDGHTADPNTFAMLTARSPQGFVALFVHPSDRCQTEWLAPTGGPAQGAAAEIERIRMFGNFMEKGVIRRGRLRCLISSQTVDTHQLARGYGEFATSPLPLTT